MKYHDYIPNGIQVTERKRNCVWNNRGEITQKVWKRELLFLYAIHCHDRFYITVKYHDYISKGIQVMKRTRNCIKKHQRGNNSESTKGKVVILVRDTSSRPVLHKYEVSWLYSKGYLSYRAGTNMHKKHQRGDNLKSIKGGAFIFCTRHIVITCPT